MLSNPYSSPARGTGITSKFIGIYSKLFQGLSPKQIAPQQDHERFFSDLLDLKVNRSYLEAELDRIPKETCLGSLKLFLSALFKACTGHVRSTKYEDSRKRNAIETQSILVSRVLAKNLAGWEVMEILGGSVSQSDQVFSEFTEALDAVMGDSEAPAATRHQVLQLGLIYMCGIAQLSTGAYFLRRDFFPSIVAIVKSTDMEQYTFEAIIFLSILANYHKSDAAKLNPYLRRIRESTDGEFMRKLCWASNFALGTSVKAYQEISDDSAASTLASSFGSAINRLRPIRALSLTNSNPPGDRFKDQPIEATVVLLPIYEFLRPNPLFASVLIEDLVSPPDSALGTTPLFCTILSLASYLCTHASSTASPRSTAYAGLSLNIMLSLVENNMVMEFISQTKAPVIRLCRQRLPTLPPPRQLDQPPICSILDCCLLWLRHNLHKRLEVYSYTNCIWIGYRIVWFLQRRQLRLDYDWAEFWNSIFGLLNFLVSKMDTLRSTGGIELLASETLRLLDLALCTAESYLPSPQALHEFIYELVRSSSILRKQEVLLKALTLPFASNTRSSFSSDPIDATLAHILKIVDFFEEKIGVGIGNAKDAMKIVADEIEANELQITRELQGITPVTRSQDVLDFGRIACADMLTLIP